MNKMVCSVAIEAVLVDWKTKVNNRIAKSVSFG